jgi:hypothetical protein
MWAPYDLQLHNQSLKSWWQPKNGWWLWIFKSSMAPALHEDVFGSIHIQEYQLFMNFEHQLVGVFTYFC